MSDGLSSASKPSGGDYRKRGIQDTAGTPRDRDGLRATKEYAEIIVDAVHEGLLVLDLDLRVRSANQSFYQMFKVRPEETTGRRVYELGNGQWDIPELRKLLKEVLPDNEGFKDYEVEHDFPEIGRRTMRLDVRQLGHRQLILFAIEDVTERLRTRQELEQLNEELEERVEAQARKVHEQEERFRRIVTTADEGIWEVDAKARTVYVNEAMADMLGYTTEEMQGRSLFDFVFTEDRREIYKLREERRAGQSDNFDFRYRRKDGSTLWAHVAANPLYDHAGAFDGALGMITDITERKQAELALQLNKNRLETALEIAQLGIWEYDVAEGLTYWDERCREVFGVTGERPRSDEEVFALIHPKDRERVQERVGEALGPKKRKRFEVNYRIVRPDGTQRWIAVHGQAAALVGERTGQRTRGGFVGTLMDITERKETEKALQHALSQSEAMLDQMTEGLVIFDSEGNLLDMNPAALAIHGFETVESIPRHLDTLPDMFELFDLEGRPLPTEAWPIGRALREQTFDTYEVRVRRCDTGKMWIGSYGGTPVYGPDGEFLLAIVTLRDVTEEREAEQALRRSEERFRKAMEIETVGVTFWSSDIEIVEVNDAFLQITGFDRADVIGKSWRELTPEPHHSASERAMVQLKARGVNIPYQKEYYRKDGSRWWGLFAARRLNEDEVVEFVLDITEQKEAEEELYRLTETLEERVEERTRQVRQLASKLTMAEQQERRRISQILHDDLQQLLYGIEMKITSISRVHARTGGPSMLADELNQLRAWVERAFTTTRQLTVDLSPPVLEGEGLADALEWLQQQMEELHNLQVHLVPEHRFCFDDEDLRVLLFQIVRELLFNVEKHAGSKRATVRLARAEEDGHLVVYVIDDGIGFDLEAVQQEKQQASFGLYSARKRLELLGGHLEIDTAPGEGTHVEVHAPMRATELPKADAPRAAEAPAEDPIAETGGRT